MFGIIKTGGKQYRVQEGDVLNVEKLTAGAGEKFHFSQVLLIADDKDILIGTPFIEKALVRAEVIGNFKDEKIIVFKKKRRKQFRRTRGHRQELTRVKIERIIPDVTALPPEELKVAEKKPAPTPAPAAPEKEIKPEAVAEKAPAPAEKKPAKREEKPKEKPKEAKREKGRKAAQAKKKVQPKAPGKKLAR